MHCPYCATALDTAAERCPACGLALRPRHQVMHIDGSLAALAARPDAMAGRWRRQRHGLGLLLVLCSLLVGCFIPISLGLFAGASGLGALVTLLAGLAGVLLLLGIMLLLAAEGQLLTAPAPAAGAGPAAERRLPLDEPLPEDTPGHERQAADVRRR